MGKLSAPILFICVILVSSGCSRPAVRCTAPEDNPGHHYLAGMELLEDGKVDAAAEKFSRSAWCDDSYAPARAGAAIAAALKASVVKDAEYRKADVKKVYGQLRSARKYSRTPEDEFTWRLASMRVSAALRDKGWLGEVEGGYRAASRLKADEGKLVFYQGRESADYFMGLAYLGSGEFQKARDRFSSVLDAKWEGRWHGPSDQAWKRTDKVVRALSGVTLGRVGGVIAMRDTVSRADMAALFVDELKVDKLFAGRIPVKAREAPFVPADVLDSPFREEVLSMMKWGVRGLEPAYDEATRAFLFRPGDPVRRKELAMALEDIVIRLTGNAKLASAFLGHGTSPFPDVDASSPWYNAVMSVTTRNLMETGLSGEFRPDDAVDGAEAVMAVRVLRHHLNIH